MTLSQAVLVLVLGLSWITIGILIHYNLQRKNSMDGFILCYYRHSTNTYPWLYYKNEHYTTYYNNLPYYIHSHAFNY